MKALLASDIDLIAKKTKLTTERAKALIELEFDLDLVLNELSKVLTREEALSLSPRLYFKTAIFKFTQKKPFHIAEKSYVASAVYQHLPQVAVQKKTFSSTPTEKSSQFLLIASAMANKDLGKRRSIDTGFRLNGQRELANHIDEWVQALREMRQEGWLSEKGVIKGDEKIRRTPRRRISTD